MEARSKNIHEARLSITERKEGGSSILASLKIAGAMKAFGMRE
jgi:hypothetical protein